MRFLSESKYQQEAELMLRQLFIEDNVYEATFSPQVKERRIIYGFDSVIFPPLSNAMVKAATNMGDVGFYYTTTCVSKTEPVRHCYIPFTEFNLPWEQRNQEDWDKIESFHCCEHIVYSPSGKWGFLFAEEHHALIAGTNEMMQAIEKAIPDLNFEEQIHDFMKHWQYYNSNGFHTDWIFALLTQLCGEVEAQNLLDRYDMKPMRKL